MSLPLGAIPVPRPDLSHVVTEDDRPVDNIYSEKQQSLFRNPLYTTWKHHNDGRRFVAMTNVGLFFTVKQPPIVLDGLLSLDVELPDDLMQKENRSYFIWEYGKVPELTLEIVSNNEGEELGSKKQDYARIGILYYVVWDPANILACGRLQAFCLTGKKYRPMKKLWFEEIDLGMTIWHGSFEDSTQDWLRWCDRQGVVVPTAEERAEKLAAQLRALGIEPEA